MQATVQVIEPAGEIMLATLFELKALLGYAQTDSPLDTGLELMLRRASGEIAAYCRRTFAQETVVETFRNFSNQEVFFLSRFPVNRIVSVSSAGSLVGWDIDAASGMLVPAGTWSSPLAVHYVGGYKLPAEAPQALRQAALILCRESIYQATAQAGAAASGIRMISHKESRIQFQNTTTTSTSSSTGPSTSALASGSSAARRAIGDLLIAYTKFTM